MKHQACIHLSSFSCLGTHLCCMHVEYKPCILFMCMSSGYVLKLGSEKVFAVGFPQLFWYVYFSFWYQFHVALAGLKLTMWLQTTSWLCFPSSGTPDEWDNPSNMPSSENGLSKCCISLACWVFIFLFLLSFCCWFYFISILTFLFVVLVCLFWFWFDVLRWSLTKEPR